MSAGHAARVVVHRCDACDGVFCAGEALDELIRTVWTRLADLPVRVVDPAATGIECPRCSGALVPSTVDERPVIERCASCAGFWLDAGELDELRRAVERIDDATMDRIMGSDGGRRLQAALLKRTTGGG